MRVAYSLWEAAYFNSSTVVQQNADQSRIEQRVSCAIECYACYCVRLCAYFRPYALIFRRRFCLSDIINVLLVVDPDASAAACYFAAEMRAFCDRKRR